MIPLAAAHALLDEAVFARGASGRFRRSGLGVSGPATQSAETPNCV